MAALAHRRLGEDAPADEMLVEARRTLRRAELNGVDNGEYFYMLGGVAAVDGEPEEALGALESAYAKGFRRGWMLDIDQRFEVLRDDPRFIEFEARIDADMRAARERVEAGNVAMR
jgi:hypothetical protein